MKKKKSGSSALVRRAPRKERPTPDHEIDFSDIPELTDEQLKRGIRVGRPNVIARRVMISIRFQPGLLEDLRKLALRENKPYQTLLQEILEEGLKRRKAA